MKPIHFVSFTALACVRLSAEDFTTIEGKKYEGVTISRVEPDGLMIMTDSGIEKIAFGRLPADVQKRFGFDPNKAAQFQQQLRNEAATRRVQDEAGMKAEEALKRAQQPAPAPAVPADPAVPRAQAPAPYVSPLNRPAERASPFRADKIVALYAKNPIAADAEVKGKSFTIIGSVESIEPKDGEVFLHLKTSDSEKMLNAGIFSIRCQLSPQAVPKAAKVKVGHKVTLKGFVQGVTSGAIQVSGCEFQ